jgi:formyl-CoA transferase
LRLKTLKATGLRDPRFKEDGSFDPMPADWATIGPKLVEEAEALYRSKTSEEWAKILEANGVPAGPVYFVEELFGNPTIAANGLEVEIEHPLLGKLKMVGPPFQMSGTPLAPQGPSPMLGADTDTVLAEAGYSEKEVESLREAGVIR